jgi:hypothetical protein
MVAATWAALRVAAGPGARVHGVDRGGPGRPVLGEQVAQRFLVYLALPERRVEAPPAAAVDRRQAQVRGGRNPAGCEDRVRQLEEGIRPPAVQGLLDWPVEAFHAVVNFAFTQLVLRSSRSPDPFGHSLPKSRPLSCDLAARGPSLGSWCAPRDREPP